MGASGNDGAPSMDDICATLNGIPGYAEQFEAVFGGPATPDHVAYAVAAFMRTIVTTTENSRFIAYRNGVKKLLMSRKKVVGWYFQKKPSV
jgi:cytochrome c peroxidase